MSDTPRTDEVSFESSEQTVGQLVVPVQFARRLEREVAELLALSERIHKSAKELEQYRRR